MDLNRAGWRTWALLLALLVLLAVALLLVGGQRAPVERRAARLLHQGSGMNATPSPWPVGWLAVGAFAAVVASFARALQQTGGRP